jgi:signal transduction histidine kinase
MTIRTKFTLWYAGVLFASLILSAFLLYQEWVIEPTQKHGAEAHNMDAIVDSLQDAVCATIPAAIVGLAGGWWLMRKTLTPVALLTTAAEQIKDTNLKVRLPQSGNGDELDRLTGVFNAMTARLDDSFNRIREFTLRASHELKTPLTIIRGELETALAEEEMTEPQRNRLLDELDEIDRLTKIVDGLTTLTKGDAGLIKLRRELVQFDELVRDSYADALVLARPYNVKVTLESCEKAIVSGDNYRLRQVLLNLMDNAVKYNQADGSVTLALHIGGDFAELTIINTGPGITPEQASQLFEPFFRGDAAHNRSVDGCGLGLAIARWIVTAHHGTLAIESRPGEMTVATLRLPTVSPSCGATG